MLLAAWTVHDGQCCFPVTQSCSTLCDPVDCGPPGSSVRGLSQAEYWSRLPLPSPGDLPDPGIEPTSPALQEDSFPPSRQGGPCNVQRRSVNMWLSAGGGGDRGRASLSFFSFHETPAGPWLPPREALPDPFLKVQLPKGSLGLRAHQPPGPAWEQTHFFPAVCWTLRTKGG